MTRNKSGKRNRKSGETSVLPAAQIIEKMDFRRRILPRLHDRSHGLLGPDVTQEVGGSKNTPPKAVKEGAKRTSSPKGANAQNRLRKPPKATKELVDRLARDCRDDMNRFHQSCIAIAKLYDEKLYKIYYDNFKDFAVKKLGLSYPTAYNMVKYARVLAPLFSKLRKYRNVSIFLPECEGHLRPLLPLLKSAPDKILDVCTKVYENSDGKPITARDVKKTIEKVVPPMKKQHPNPRRSGNVPTS